MASLDTILNTFRFIAMALSLFFLESPDNFLTVTVFSTTFYSLIIPFLPSTYFGVIFHKSISHVPSTILYIYAANSDLVYRLNLLILVTIQYFGIWLEMYSEVFTLQLKSQISQKTKPGVLSEFLWAAHDGFLIIHIAEKSYPLSQTLRIAYQVAFVLFVLRVSLNFFNLLASVLRIVEKEPKKKSN